MSWMRLGHRPYEVFAFVATNLACAAILFYSAITVDLGWLIVGLYVLPSTEIFLALSALGLAPILKGAIANWQYKPRGITGRVLKFIGHAYAAAMLLVFLGFVAAGLIVLYAPLGFWSLPAIALIWEIWVKFRRVIARRNPHEAEKAFWDGFGFDLTFFLIFVFFGMISLALANPGAVMAAIAGTWYLAAAWTFVKNIRLETVE